VGWLGVGYLCFGSSYKAEGGKALVPERLRCYSSDSKGGCAVPWLSDPPQDASPLPDGRQADVGHSSSAGEGMLLVVECHPEKVSVCFLNARRSDGS